MKKILFTMFSILLVFSALQAAENKSLVLIKNENQLTSLLQNSGKKTYVDVYLTYCPPCKRLAPKFEKWAENNADKASFAKVNTQEVSGIAKKYSIQKYPTVLVFDEDGNLVDKKVGLDQIIPLIKNSL